MKLVTKIVLSFILTLAALAALGSLVASFPDLLEINIFKISTGKVAASNLAGMVGKDVDPEDIAAAEKDQTVVLFAEDEGTSVIILQNTGIGAVLILLVGFFALALARGASASAEGAGRAVGAMEGAVGAFRV